MVRPSYPPFYYERHVRKIEADQAPLVVVYGSWKIEFFPPPLGEGETYKALRKEVRPTLDWSLEDGWTLPNMDGRKSRSVKLLKSEKGDHVTPCADQTGKEQTERAKRQRTEREMQQKKGRGEIRLNIEESDSVEAAVYDLEELIVRIEWIKKMLSPDVGEGSTWKYQDYRPSSKGM
ncbi:BnaC03g15670D [Brassica napus]|nr:unnamed protein product [Brassica napus]CDY32599.1 BnaC03g15670D [Brassica napus]VDC88253.1 unnamed protein product [Brassica oleracea]